MSTHIPPTGPPNLFISRLQEAGPISSRFYRSSCVVRLARGKLIGIRVNLPQLQNRAFVLEKGAQSSNFAGPQGTGSSQMFLDFSPWMGDATMCYMTITFKNSRRKGYQKEREKKKANFERKYVLSSRRAHVALGVCFLPC